MNSVLLTVDLTKAVVDEAIERDDSIIIAYRAFSRFYFLTVTHFSWYPV
jgi:putative NIF3 family GTP cyclohydrolase 1 type 2